MKKQEAEQILIEKEQKQAAEIQAEKTLEEERGKRKAEAEKKRKKEEFEKQKERYPDSAGEIYQKCWKCKKQVNMSSGEHITRSTRIIIVAECEKCNSFNVAVIPTNNRSMSSHDRFFAGIDLNLS